MREDPVPQVESSFAIFVVVFALVGFSYVVGSILGSLAQLRSMTEQSAKAPMGPNHVTKVSI